jgi:hypothetical protein
VKEDMHNPFAFPREYRTGGRDGMTLRDYFAGQALVGLLAARHINPHDYPLKRAAEISAEKSYAIADAMLEARGEAS